MEMCKHPKCHLLSNMALGVKLTFTHMDVLFKPTVFWLSHIRQLQSNE